MSSASSRNLPARDLFAVRTEQVTGARMHTWAAGAMCLSRCLIAALGIAIPCVGSAEPADAAKPRVRPVLPDPLGYASDLRPTIVPPRLRMRRRAVSPRAIRDLVLDSYSSASVSPLGCFPATTDAERELEKMLAGPDSGIEPDAASYLIASDLPAFREFTRSQFDQELLRTTEHVAGEIQRASDARRAAGRIAKRSDKVFDFCDAIRSLGIDYNDEFRTTSATQEQVVAMYRDERNVFLTGLMATRRGSCVSMPMIYLCVGRKLGYPVHLVMVGNHLFIRWQESTDLYLNIETTIASQTAVAENEDVFLEAEGLTRAEIAGTNWLRNLSNREIVASLLFARSGCHSAMDRVESAYRDCRRAVHLAPGDRLAQITLGNLEEKMRPGLKALGIPTVTSGRSD